jgi:hypothetical protein
MQMVGKGFVSKSEIGMLKEQFPILIPSLNVNISGA